MSDAHNEHESLIKTPKQLIAAVIAGFVVPIAIIVLLVHYVSTSPKSGAGSNAQSAESIAERIKPVADEGFTLAAAGGQRELKTGEQVYSAACAACHASGAAGAPKFGDAGAWGGRIGQGYDTLVSHAIKGIRAMPAKGGNPDLDDVEVARAVVHLANASGAKFKEPAAPEPKAAEAKADEPKKP
jgi:cytochrome c5